MRFFLAILCSLSCLATLFPTQSPSRLEEANTDFVELNFVVDETVLITTLVFAPNSARFHPAIVEFQKHMFDACKEECLLIAPLVEQKYFLPEWAALDYKDKEPYKKCFDKLVCEAKKTAQYPILLTQTKQRLAECRDQWRRNYETTFALMKGITGIPFRHSFSIYIIHPGIPSGCNMTERRICWGGEEKKKNWTTVYLWHEILHSYLIDPTYLGHALIEIATDNELRHLINGRNDPEWGGHEECSEIKKLIASDWKAYIASPKKNIVEFYQELCKKYPAERYPDE